MLTANSGSRATPSNDLRAKSSPSKKLNVASDANPFQRTTSIESVCEPDTIWLLGAIANSATVVLTDGF